MRLKDALTTYKKSNVKAICHKLCSPFGEALDKKHILEEYPRPQMLKKHYYNLNGYWDYGFNKKELQGKILVPFSPETALSEVNRQLQPGETLWYHLTLPESITTSPFQNGHCLLHFGAVDCIATVYINDQEVAHHIGGYLPFTCDITAALSNDKNDLWVKVIDPTDTSYHSRGKQKLKSGGMFYTAQSGIWQTVWLEWVPNCYIEALKITPSNNLSQVIVQVIPNRSDAPSASLHLFDDCNYTIDEVKRNTFHINIPNAKCWTPENPYLYKFSVSLGEDYCESYFAIRSFEVKKDTQGIPRFFLNGKPYFLHGVLDQGYWPESLYTAPSDEAFIFDITEMKKIGFNMIRKHIKIEPLRFYYHCDRLGMIVWQDMVNGGGKYSSFLVTYLATVLSWMHIKISDHHYHLLSRSHKEGRKEWLSECADTIAHLYNVPSIAAWIAFNEGWGQFDSVKVTEIIRRLDSSRTIDSASGWFDHKAGDYRSVHTYFTKLIVEKTNRAFVISEYGGYACPVKEHTYSDNVYGYKKYTDCQSFAKDFWHLINKELLPLETQGLCGAVYTQLSDIEEETNGILTYDRRINKLSI